MDRRKPSAQNNTTMAEVIFAPVHPELKRLIGERADKAGVPMNEYVAKILADHIGKKELAAIPRKKMGRPRKAAAS